jgi:hypothetical protein
MRTVIIRLMNSEKLLQYMLPSAILTFTKRTLCLLLAIAAAGYGQSGGKAAKPVRLGSAQDEAAIRSLLAEGFETGWNSHQPARALTRDKCADDAIFINTTGGWVKGCETVAEMLSRLHAPGGPFHEQTRRHTIEELRFIRPDVAIAVVKIFDIRQAGVPAGYETRGLMIVSKEDGLWKVNAGENTRIGASVEGQR